jgi:hypothetical protein
LSQVNPVHTIPSYLSKIHFNIFHPHTSWSSQWSLSLNKYDKYNIIKRLSIRQKLQQIFWNWKIWKYQQHVKHIAIAVFWVMRLCSLAGGLTSSQQTRCPQHKCRYRENLKFRRLTGVLRRN